MSCHALARVPRCCATALFFTVLTAAARPAQEPAPRALPHEVVARFPGAEEGRVADTRTSPGGEAVALFVRDSDGVELRVSGREPIRYAGYVRHDPNVDAWNVVRPMGELDEQIAGDVAKKEAWLDWDSFAFDASGAHCVWTVYDRGAWRVVVDGQPQEGFAGIGEPLLGPGGHVAYAVAQEERRAVSRDGTLGPVHGEVDELVFSASGADLAYIAMDEGQERVVVFGAEPGPAFDLVYRGTLRFAGDDKRVSYLAQRAGKDVAVIAGTESEPCDALADVFLSSPDGRRCVYGVQSADGWRIVLDGKAGPAWEATSAWTFSPDGRRFAHRGARGKSAHVWIDGQESPAFDDISDLLVFSPDGKRTGYGAIRAGRWLAVIDGREGEPCDGIGGVAFSADGQHVAHLEFLGSSFRLVVDGKAGEWLGGQPLTNPCFRPGSAGVVLLVQGLEGKQVLLDGKLGPAWDWATPPEFDARGAHCLVAAGKGEESFVVLDGEAQPVHGNFMTLPAFVRDGESLLSFVWRAEQAHLLLDGQSLATFDEVFVPADRRLELDENGGLTVLARSGDELRRVRWAP